jgi:hypothetical protein
MHRYRNIKPKLEVFEEFLLDEHIRIPALAGVRRRYL